MQHIASSQVAVKQRLMWAARCDQGQDAIFEEVQLFAGAVNLRLCLFAVSKVAMLNRLKLYA